MKTLIIYAHPEHKGHCKAILDNVAAKLESKKIPFEVIDLYKLNYDPVLHKNEHYSAGFKDVSEQNRHFQDKIKSSNKLILIYPVWWGGMPAILKGFIDRVFVSGFAFSYEGSSPKGLLHGKKAAVIMTSGAPNLFIHLMGVSFIVKMGILKFCGIKSKTFVLGKSREYSKEKDLQISKLVDKSIKYLYS
jgi:NAD(P)H dehydrogenase (quinone)